MQKPKYYTLYMVKTEDNYNIIIKLEGLEDDDEANILVKTLQYFLDDIQNEYEDINRTLH